MRKNEFIQAKSPESLVESLSRYQPQEHEHHHEAMESVRKATYRGHKIVIRTSYHIEVDGAPIQGHMGVTNDGQVHYHPIPNLSFDSAVDLVKQLIDTFPDDFTTSQAGHSHG